MLAAAVRDRTNPPLFYVLLKTWIGVGGTSVAWMRLLPCVLGILAAVPVVALARRLGTTATVATVAAAAASPLAVLRSNELRGYSLLLLLSATSLLCYARLVETAAWLAPGTGDGESPSWRGLNRTDEHHWRDASCDL